MIKIFIHKYDAIISIENLLNAWQNFKRNKKNKKDVQVFERDLMKNILELYRDLKDRNYTHSSYTHFKINDPKPRDIHKAEARDRVVHHLLYEFLYPFFNNTFISDSYSCRLGRGTHKGLHKFRSYILKVSKNKTKACFVLKCDIKKFFANIDHRILKEILIRKIQDKTLLNLLDNIIDSFHTGLPLGNLTSQLLVNIYMNEFDQYMKHKLKVKYYIRYADDFVILNNDRLYLENLVVEIDNFLKEKLKLELHPNKVSVESIYSGVDFLGWVDSSTHRVLRNTTKKRMFRNLKNNNSKIESVASYLGMLKVGQGFKLKERINLLNKIS
ncbi:MAG: reverse transcriptase/maturase family protein [Candidatus Paceibacterota bacterium]